MKNKEIYELSDESPIVFYDGVCNLCNGFVQMIIRNDPEGHIKFCALQGEGGAAIREKLQIGDNFSAVIGLHKGEIYTHSDVMKMIGYTLGGKWKLMIPFYILPKVMRDGIYNWVARNRYNWFGKADSCVVPEEGVMDRFVR